MSAIKILPENLINQIAAGEVVERHASVVKELIENAIDAKADKIILEIYNKEHDTIKITDNGTGMNFDDARLAFERHATSKISKLEDIEKISTMGFRGEAIASIASVSHMILRTRRAGEKTGTIVECEYGKIKKHEECGCQEGTQIEVRNLFFNTPARKKYLKSASLEYRHILSDFQAIAIANPSIHFKLVNNKKESFEYPVTKNLTDRIRYIFGENTANNCLQFDYKNEDFKIDGYIGTPSIARSGTKHQYLFVNGRHIKHGLFNYAVSRGYDSMLMVNKKPFFVLNIKIKPELVDVNVHPRKLEVRFTNENAIFAALQQHSRETLQSNSLMPSIEYTQIQEKPLKLSDSNYSIKFDEPAKASNEYKGENRRQTSMSPIAQIANSYIVAENAEGLVLIDQHAAHERVMYEKFKNQYENSNKTKQRLLMPQNIELSAFEAEILRSNADNFEKLGFEIEPFGKTTYIIHAVPSALVKENFTEIILSTINDLAEHKDTNSAKESEIKIIEYMACRSAIKFGKALSHEEMLALIEQLDELKLPYTCPHGRPSMIKLSFDELSKRFKRT